MRGEPIPLGEGLGVDNVGLASISASTNGVSRLPLRPSGPSGGSCGWTGTARRRPALEGRAGVRRHLAVPRRQPPRLRRRRGRRQGGPLDPRLRARHDDALHLRARRRSSTPVWSPDGRGSSTSMQRKNWDLYVQGRRGDRRAGAAAGERRGQVRDRLVARRRLRSSSRAAARRPTGTSGRCR